MRLLMESHDITEIERVRSLLMESGIPVIVRITNPNNPRNPAPVRGSTRGIFVCLDPQYDDAAALLADPNHVVTQAVDAEQYLRDESRLFVLSTPFMIVTLMCLLIIAFVFFRLISHFGG